MTPPLEGQPVTPDPQTYPCEHWCRAVSVDLPGACDCGKAKVRAVVAERDDLRARLDAAVRSYELKVADLARETAVTSAAHEWATDRGPASKANRGIVGEALGGYLDAQADVERLLIDARKRATS